MQFIITAYDGANRLERRMQVRPQHLANLEKINGRVICAGGILDEGNKMKGSVLIMEFETRELLNK